jgi:uncharacterized coiled-coil protein SlyX
MKAILYVVAIIAALGAIYFTLDHTKKFEALQKDRIETIKKNKDTSANADVTENKLKHEKEVLVTSQSRREELTQSITQLKSTGSTLKRQIEELDATLASQDAEFAELKKTMDEVQKILADLGGNVTLDNLADKMKEILEEKKTRQEKLDELQTLVASAEKLLEKNRAEVDRLMKRDMERNTHIGRNSMESVVTAVNQDWGFLVIGAGSNSGFTPQTSLIVQRNGRLIGRVHPSAIEPTQTIAEIDFNSLATGVRLQPGDRVMLAKPVTN